MRITLPWPDKGLSPNARLHRMAVAGLRKAYRWHCAMAFIERGGRGTGAAHQHLDIIFHPPDRRRRDLDNMLSSIKSGLDGIADVIGVDDSLWSLTISRGMVVKGGMVAVIIMPEAGSTAAPVIGAIGAAAQATS